MAKIIRYGFGPFFLILFIFALVEEYLWDQLFRLEQTEFWGSSLHAFANNLPDFWYALIIGLLIVPQLTHYFLDGYVWRREFKSGI